MSKQTDFQDGRFARPIRQLDRVLINKIAAGEVIERPASVVKELVENSFDAGATAVDIIARKAGMTFISVADNGCGIPSDQIRLAFSRHATSKIENLDELFAIQSFGFRGEALPSIASVSHLAMTTRHFSQNGATHVVCEGGKEIQSAPTSAPVGTKIEVSHLFFNTPARRKFLKAETTESRQIIRVAERMALGRPSVAMKLSLNEREAFSLPTLQPLADRLAMLFGVKRESLVEYDVELGGVSYNVYLAHPEQARHDRTRICLFINGRSVASSSIIHAVTSGYGEFLPAGRFPLACVYITLDPALLDVNVHPTKAEVRLSDENAIHDNLYRIVKKALRDWRLVPSAGASSPNSRPSAPFRPGSGNPPPLRMPLLSPGRTDSFFTKVNKPVEPPAESRILSFREQVESSCDPGRPPAETAPDAGIPADGVISDDIILLGKVGRAYLLMTIGGELYIADQHAAHERVLYEDALRQVEREGSACQKLLFPETVELSSEEFLTFEGCLQLLTRLGFDAGPFGQNSVIIQGIPPVFGDHNPGQVMRTLLDDIMQSSQAGGELTKAVAQSLACRAAVMAGDRLSPEEAVNLMRSLLASNNPYCCPHGRPTFIKISQEELDDRFGRT